MLFGDIEDEDLEDAFDELDKDIAKDKEEKFDLPNVPVNLRTKRYWSRRRKVARERINV